MDWATADGMVKSISLIVSKAKLLEQERVDW
jgi:hypothetical protein